MIEILHHILHALIHTAEHTFYMLPVLFLVYLVIELLEHKAMDKVKSVLGNKIAGIPAAAVLGLFPQCGFSVAAANLYSEHLITAGTLAAVFVATSDEAFPILLASPERIKWFVPLLLFKLVFAILVGITVNGIFKLTKLDSLKPSAVSHHHHSEHTHEGGEHHHCSHCDSGKGIFSAAVRRTVSIFLFLFVTSFLLHLVIDIAGEERISSILMTNSLLQPVIAAIFGLIPSCAMSVIVTELFTAGALGFGALLSALCTGAGVGMLVLFRVNRNLKQNLAIMGIICAMSAILGVIIEILI